MPRKRDRGPDEPTFRFDRVIFGTRVTRRSGTRAWRQFEADNAILTQLEQNGQRETIRLFVLGEIDMPDLRAAAARGQLASGSLIADMALRKKLWGDDGAFAVTLPKMGRSPETRRRYGVSMLSLERKAAKWLGADATVADLEHVAWNDLRQTWGMSGSDWNHLRRMLSRFLSVLLADKYHPYRRRIMALIAPRGENERTPDLTPKQFWQVVAKAPDYVRPAFVTLVATGMRWGEYRRCRKSHLRPGVHAIAVPGRKTETAAATVYVDKRLWRWIVAGIPAPLGYKWTRIHWKRACAAAKVTGIRLHDLRHLHGQLAIETVDVTKVADGLRHTQLATTRRYVRQKNRRDVAKAVASALGSGRSA